MIFSLQTACSIFCLRWFSLCIFIPDKNSAMAKAFTNNKALNDLDKLARLMDNQFRIPGTQVRFGLDSIMGLVPGVGDLSSLAISGYMLVVMMRNGASGFLLARMVLNVLVDATIGAIPLIGDLFDIAFKANTKNMRLMRQHYAEGRHQGGAWKLIIPVVLVILLFFAGLAWLLVKFFSWLF